MFEEFNYASIPSDELYTFSSGMIGIIKPKSELFSYVSPFVSATEETLETFQEALSRNMTNPYTQKIGNLDIKVDNGFRAFKGYCHIAQLREEEGWKEAAETLEMVIRKYNWHAHNLGHKAQIANMSNLIKEIDEKYLPLIELIEAMDWYTYFKTVLLEFVNLYNESASYVPEHDVTLKEARPALINATRNLLQIIKLMGQHDTSQEFAALVGSINEHIIRTMTTVKAAITREANKEEVSQEPETENN